VNKQGTEQHDKAGEFGIKKKGGAIGVRVSSDSNLLFFQFAESFLSVVQIKLVVEKVFLI
jgi:hypothetical protein